MFLFDALLGMPLPGIDALISAAVGAATGVVASAAVWKQAASKVKVDEATANSNRAELLFKRYETMHQECQKEKDDLKKRVDNLEQMVFPLNRRGGPDTSRPADPV